MNNAELQYEGTAEKLVSIIDGLVPEHPEILNLTSAWDLFKIDGFDCSDLQPTLFQANWALAKVIAKHE